MTSKSALNSAMLQNMAADCSEMKHRMSSLQAEIARDKKTLLHSKTGHGFSPHGFSHLFIFCYEDGQMSVGFSMVRKIKIKLQSYEIMLAFIQYVKK